MCYQSQRSPDPLGESMKIENKKEVSQKKK